MSSKPRIVIVTGAAAGIGLATARAFAAAGDTVVLTDIDGNSVAVRAAELGAAHIGLVMDVSDEANVAATIAQVAARFGRIDVLINNAGIVDPHATMVVDKPIDEVRRLIAVNMTGAYLCAREAARVMLAQKSGSIVNLSSGAALSALPGRTPYSMTKAAILGLTRALSAEWAGGGVRVNAVLPGYVGTEILKSLERAGKFDPTTVSRAVPLGRMAEPEEIAAAILHVAGASYVTGAAVSVDGGVSAYGGSGPASTAPAPRAGGGGVVLIAGGADGIGAAMTDRFVADGARVVVFDRDAAAIAALGSDRIGVVIDPTDDIAVEAAVARIAAEVGPITCLVSDPGRADPAMATIDQRLADFAGVFDVKLTGSMIVARAVARAMIAQRSGGTIVTLSPARGASVRNADHAAKAALVMLTKSLACEWAAHGIRVNAIAPGYVAGSKAPAPDHIRELIPMGRLGEAAEVAEIAAFLASDAASYVTGMTYVVDGGCAAALG
jgi:NAD(P)-dependent dehydrogenase (short-subunit alcohol dehydrogenase family)